jgi:hypothetical protein
MKPTRKGGKQRGSDRGGIRKGGPGDSKTAIARDRELVHCQAYRAWVNATGGAANRTVGVFPSGISTFPAGTTVTVFVAPENHAGAPPAGSNPTTVAPEGDSIGKNVPNGSAVFVHFNATAGRKTRAVIDDGP